MPNSSTIPPFPQITSVDWAPPSATDPVEVSTISTPLKICADADNANYKDYVLDVPAGSGSPRLNNWWDNQSPPPRLLRLRQFWRQVPGTFTHLTPGLQFQKQWQYTNGVSTTDEQSITVQLGIEADGLSAGMSATFSQSITVSSEQSETTLFTQAGPDSGVLVWVLWDLTYELTVLNANTLEQIPAGTYRGDVDFSNDSHYSGAYLNYQWTKKVISSGSLIPQSQLFAKAQAAFV